MQTDTPVEKPKRIHLDFETRSAADIKDVGAWKYAAHKTTVILCMVYAIDDEPPVLWTPTDPEPKEFLDAIEEGALIVAHNVFFERSVWKNICVPRLGWPEVKDEQWVCTMAKAAAHALPRALGACGNALKLPVVKDEAAKRVMLKLSQYRKPSKNNSWPVHENPEDYKILYDYCLQDVEAERAIDEFLRDLSPFEQDVWRLDQRINQRGVYVDRDAVLSAITLINYLKELYNDEMDKVTDGEVETGTQVQRLINWVNDRGYNVSSLDKAAIARLLDDSTIDAEVKEALEIRKEISKTSTGKYFAMWNALCEDDRIRDYLMYHAASTGRWSSKIVQFQNIPRGTVKDMDAAVEEILSCSPEAFFNAYEHPMDQLSGCIRGMIRAPEGKDLIVADYAAIEGRAVMWLAEEEETLQIYRDKDANKIDHSMYEVMGSKIFGTTIEEVIKDHKAGGIMRFVGKQATLGCGYQMGASKFQGTCESFGQSLPFELCETAVGTFRGQHPKLKNMWYAQENAAIRAVMNKNTPVDCGKITWLYARKFLWCKLPSGRMLAYYAPQVRSVIKWGKEMPELSFMGIDTYTKQWTRVSTYGGKLVENITQAVARDLMAHAMIELDKHPLYDVVLTVHDEIIAEVDENCGSVDEFCGIMGSIPEWAKGMPVMAEGWIGKRYRK